MRLSGGDEESSSPFKPGLRRVFSLTRTEYLEAFTGYFRVFVMQNREIIAQNLYWKDVKNGRKKEEKNLNPLSSLRSATLI